MAPFEWDVKRWSGTCSAADVGLGDKPWPQTISAPVPPVPGEKARNVEWRVHSHQFHDGSVTYAFGAWSLTVRLQ